MAQALLTDTTSKKPNSQKARAFRKLETISKSTNDLSMAAQNTAKTRSSSSSIPIVLNKAKSKSVSSLKKSQDNKTKNNPSSHLKKSNETKKASLLSPIALAQSKEKKVSKNSGESLKKSCNFLPLQEKNATESKTFKRTIINKKLPVRLNLKNTKQQNSPSVVEPPLEDFKPELEKKLSSNLNKELNSKIENLSQKREIVLVKDENLGFGFIAGSEKPLVIRFVTPGFIFF